MEKNICKCCLKSKNKEDFYLRNDAKKLREICNDCYILKNPNSRISKSYINKLLSLEGKLTCTICDKVKSIKQFVKDKNNSGGFLRRCKSCRRDYANVRKERNRKTFLARKYNITQEDYDLLLIKQNNCCAICRTDNPTGWGNMFYIDHCHNSGNVRGLLCSHCNTGLGMFKDNIDSLEKAIKYLKNSN